MYCIILLVHFVLQPVTNKPDRAINIYTPKRAGTQDDSLIPNITKYKTQNHIHTGYHESYLSTMKINQLTFISFLADQRAINALTVQQKREI